MNTMNFPSVEGMLVHLFPGVEALIEYMLKQQDRTLFTKWIQLSGGRFEQSALLYGLAVMAMMMYLTNQKEPMDKEPIDKEPIDKKLYAQWFSWYSNDQMATLSDHILGHQDVLLKKAFEWNTLPTSADWWGNVLELWETTDFNQIVWWDIA
jgi:hypothetical protein